MNQADFWNSVEPFKDKLFRVAKRLLVSTAEAEDATQEVLLRLWVKKEKLEKLNSIEGFAVTVTKNYCLDQLKSKRAQNQPLDTRVMHLTVASEEKKLENKDAVRFVHNIIGTLPVQQQLLIQLRDIEGYTFQEIATQLEMNETNVRVALSRARKKIREQLIIRDEYRKN